MVGIINGVFFIDENTGWIVGSVGNKIMKTTDGGTTWTEQYQSGGNAVQFIDANKGWVAVGDGTILRTTDGGTTWVEVYGSGGGDL